MSESKPSDELAQGLWRRVRDVILVAERVDGFVFGPGEAPREAVAPGEEESFARDVVLRALQTASDPVNWQILDAAGAEEPARLADLAAALGLPKLVVAERANDLVQAGLATRALDIEAVHATAAGSALSALVRDASVTLAQTIVKARARKERSDEMPVL
ncbi:MAG: hypothetical protein ACRDJM_06095 [Actinomycetota bacterium]